jgi:hypothetical protein
MPQLICWNGGGVLITFFFGLYCPWTTILLISASWLSSWDYVCEPLHQLVFIFYTNYIPSLKTFLLEICFDIVLFNSFCFQTRCGGGKKKFLQKDPSVSQTGVGCQKKRVLQNILWELVKGYLPCHLIHSSRFTHDLWVYMWLTGSLATLPDLIYDLENCVTNCHRSIILTCAKPDPWSLSTPTCPFSSALCFSKSYLWPSRCCK